jgi:nicotinamidase-related amidase
VIRPRFSLTSDQLELLLAFEGAKGLAHLAEIMAKDPSVISRNLQRIAEDYPVLIKSKGRWEITPLGNQINQQTRAYIEHQSQLLSKITPKKDSEKRRISQDATLIVINAQKGLLAGTQEERNNSEAEVNIGLLLKEWRSKKRRVIHVRHVSDNPQSAFFKNSQGCEFIEMLKPLGNEKVIDKTKSSAFAGTDLEDTLNHHRGSDVVLLGFTANECIDATARNSTALGFETWVVGDATATFDLRDNTTGKLVKADRIHKLTLLNIHAFSATVITTKEILSLS